MTRSYLEANPAVVSKFLAALIEAEGWVKAHPNEAIDIVAAATGMKRDELAAIWSDYIYHVRLDDKLLETLKRTLPGGLRPAIIRPGRGCRFLEIIATASLKALDAARVTLSANP